MLKIINIAISVISLFIGFFISRKISEADKLKIQVKQFEDNQKEQNEILERNNIAINAPNKRLWFKKKRTDNNKL
jgi:hypothetical protein